MNIDEAINGFSKWRILKEISVVKLSKLEIKEGISIKDLAERINISVYSPYYYEILGVLIDMGLVEIYRIIGTSKVLKIKKAEVADIAKSCDWFEENVGAWIRTTNPLAYSY